MSKFFVINPNGSISNEVPIFMRDDGDAELDRRGKELEIYLALLTRDPMRMLSKTRVGFNPETESPKEDKAWWESQDTRLEILFWASGDHKVDGEDWFNGIFGSRWTDKVINGRETRIAFYADKGQYKGKDYALIFN